MYEVLLFVTGAIFGAIVGVIIDRLYSRWEQRTRLEVDGSVFDSINDRGVRVTIRNVGKSSLPAHQITMYSPERGSYIFGDESAEHELAVGDEVGHDILAVSEFFIKWISNDGWHNGERPRLKTIELRITRKNSQDAAPLYRNPKMGSTIARHLFELGGREVPSDLEVALPKTGWDGMQDVGWWTRYKRRRELSRVIKEHERKRKMQESPLDDAAGSTSPPPPAA